ncbi:TRAP transporter substrate-binding protein [Tenuibacillus multivorans]|uniref:TRAP-type C4-dicarboxylate transport system, substrate-binding protein n=1 Tax=Tenuibacillus multivorans TaxID=237069 RepID=A0A1H0ESD6_9BACI|nr:TRAP transporter substrate-binding protein [Tenuibacillus multivorans]GEL76975.1 C4-dicarboxylate ABC transporter [Tenuibacillus multivorans]SDN85265.1 TRAP-type C4-dicarboxylate transport system, substrate-binding protein [Tenuibacillus multivorans]
MRKSIVFFICVLMVVFLTACNSSGDGSGDSQSSGSEDGKSHNLIISHFLPGQHPIQTQVFEGIGSELESQTDGRITYELYPANALGDAGSHYDMAVTGEADIALSVYGYTPGRFPSVSVLELPFLAESAEHGSKIIWKLYEEFPEIQDEHSDTEPLFLFTAEPAQLISKDYKIESPDDLEGLRVRSPSPLGNQILEELGAAPVSMPMGDVYEALERGTVDAAMVPLETLYNYNFHEIAEYITVGNFSATPFFSVMNKDTFNSMSEEDQELLKSLVGTERSAEAGRVFDIDGQEGRKLAEENGAEFIELTDEQLKPWKDALESVTQSWIDEMEAEGIPGQEIYDRAMEIKEEVRE